MSLFEKQNRKIDEKYKNCKILHVSTTVSGSHTYNYFLVVVKMTDETVELKVLCDNEVFIIDEGEPYIGGYGCGSTGLYITEADLVQYLN
jgi:hypothetical protein